MIYTIDMDGETRVLLSHLPPRSKRKVKESLRSIAKDPFLGKTLQENLSGLYSYRIGSLRVIYSLDPSKRAVHVVAVGPRRTVYEELERELAAQREPFRTSKATA